MNSFSAVFIFDSSPSSFDTEVEGSFNKEIVEFYGIGPYGKDLGFRAVSYTGRGCRTRGKWS